jgi:hypothetical protein
MDYDHMLNGRGSRQHHQNIIRQVQAEQLAKKAKASQKQGKNRIGVRNLIMLLITMLRG